MKAKYINTLLIAAGLVCSVNVGAATYTLTPNTQNTYTVGVGQFTDTFNFALNDVSSLSATLSNIVGINPNNTNIQLFNGANTSLGSNATQLNFSSLDAGSYYLQVKGQGIGGPRVTHSYTLGTVTAPVPEPETWAMMGLGLAIVSQIARRKKSNIVAPIALA